MIRQLPDFNMPIIHYITVIEKLRKLHNAKNEEELLAAIGSKTIILGEADKNELKEKQTSNWKKYLTFSFGNNKEKQEEKEPQEKEKINPKQVLKLTEESSLCVSHSVANIRLP